MSQAEIINNEVSPSFPIDQMDEARAFLSGQLGGWHLVLRDYEDDGEHTRYAALYGPLVGMGSKGDPNATTIEFLTAENKYAVVDSGFVGDYLGTGDTVLEAITAALPSSGRDAALSPDDIRVRDRAR